MTGRQREGKSQQETRVAECAAHTSGREARGVPSGDSRPDRAQVPLTPHRPGRHCGAPRLGALRHESGRGSRRRHDGGGQARAPAGSATGEPPPTGAHLPGPRRGARDTLANKVVPGGSGGGGRGEGNDLLRRSEHENKWKMISLVFRKSKQEDHVPRRGGKSPCSPPGVRAPGGRPWPRAAGSGAECRRHEGLGPWPSGDAAPPPALRGAAALTATRG